MKPWEIELLLFFLYKNKSLDFSKRTSYEQSQACCPTEHKSKVSRTRHKNRLRYKCYFSPVIFGWLYCFFVTPISGVIDHYCNMENLKKSGKNNKLRTIYPKNFKNNKRRVQFYWFFESVIMQQVTLIKS